MKKMKLPNLTLRSLLATGLGVCVLPVVNAADVIE